MLRRSLSLRGSVSPQLLWVLSHASIMRAPGLVPARRLCSSSDLCALTLAAPKPCACCTSDKQHNQLGSSSCSKLHKSCPISIRRKSGFRKIWGCRC